MCSWPAAMLSQRQLQYERFTMLGMRQHLQPEDVFLYMHSKGIRHMRDQVHIFDWVFHMQYFVLRHYPACLRLLRAGFDVCNVDFRTKPLPHFSGNFWWARASYFLALPVAIGENYWEPETYIALGNPRYAELWESHNNFHGSEYPPIRLVDTTSMALAWQGKGLPIHARHQELQ